MKYDLKAIFERFADMEIPVLEKPYEFGSARMLGPTRYVDENSALVREMREAARDNGLSLRFIIPGQPVTTDFREDRVSVFLERANDGSWRPNAFGIG